MWDLSIQVARVGQTDLDSCLLLPFSCSYLVEKSLSKLWYWSGTHKPISSAINNQLEEIQSHFPLHLQ